MKKIFLIMIIFVGVQFAQVSKLTLRSNLSGTDNLLVNVPGVDDYKTTIDIFKAFILSGDITWSGYQNFILPFTLSTTIVAGRSRTLGFDLATNRPAWTDNYGVINQFITAYDLDTSGIGSLENVATTISSNHFSVKQYFDGGAFIDGDADFSSADNVKIVNKTSLPATDVSNTVTDIYSYGNYLYANIKGTNGYTKIAKFSDVGSGAFLPQTGTLTGLTSTLEWSSGTLKPYQIRLGSTAPSLGPGASLSDYYGYVWRSNGTGRLNFIYYDLDLEDIAQDSIATSKDINKVIEDKAVKWSAPIAITNDTLDFDLGSRFVITGTNHYFNVAYTDVATHGVLYLKNSNSDYKTVEVLIHDEVEINSIFDLGVGHYVQFPVGVTALEIPSNNGFIDFVIKVADATHRYVGYGQYYLGW